MQRRTLYALAAAAAITGIGIAAQLPGASLAVPAAAALPLSVTPLALNPDDPAAARAGALKFMGAVQLRSTDALFGGLSGLRWVDGRLLALSDTGNWLSLVTIERDGRLAGVADAHIAPVLMADGRPAATKEDGDAEAVEWSPDGTAEVIFEQDHRHQVYRGIDPARPGSFAAVPVRVLRYPEARHWPANGGGEAFARLDAAAALLFAEEARVADGTRDVLLLTAAGAAHLAYRPPDGFSPTDAVLLDRDRLLVLNRRFTPASGVAAVLVLVDLAPLNAARAAGAVPPGLVLEGRELARLAPPLTVDNMEGLALRREGGRVFLYMVSDDNLNSIQRTILMKFELDFRSVP